MSKQMKAFDRYDLKVKAHGIVRLFLFDKATKRITQVIERHNLILFSGADILGQCLAGNPQFAVSSMYLEFKNLPSPSTPITPPTYDRTGGVGYYNGLIGSPDTDFIRVPLTVNPDISASGPAYESNRITFFGMTEGTVGFHGKQFNPSVNSAVFGAALVATPQPGDQSKDVVFSRVYSGIDKILKVTGYEVGVTWTIQLN